MRRILIVDDAPMSRNAMARLLQQEGYETALAANGAEALAKLKSLKPDLIVLDHMMPEVDGLTSLPTPRRFPRWKKTPFIMLTGMKDKTAMSQARARGVKKSLVKADERGEELVRQVNRHIGG